MKFEIPAFDEVVVALSGGADSVALLHYLVKNSNIKIHAVHINHNIQEHSCSWVSFCKNMCISLGVEFTAINLHLDKKTENEARNKRYEALKSFGLPIFTGHHADDQTETFFLKIMRGAGVSGLKCMKQIAQHNDYTIVRPMLEVHKIDIINYCYDNGLEFVKDPSNEANYYDRNYFRNEVLTKIDIRFPAFRKALSKSIKNMQDADECLRDLADLDLISVMDNESISIELIREKNMSEARIRNMLVYYMQTHNLTLNCEELVAFSKKILTISYDGRLELIGRGKTIKKLKQTGKRLFLY